MACWVVREGKAPRQMEQRHSKFTVTTRKSFKLGGQIRKEFKTMSQYLHGPPAYLVTIRLVPKPQCSSWADPHLDGAISCGIAGRKLHPYMVHVPCGDVWGRFKVRACRPLASVLVLTAAQLSWKHYHSSNDKWVKGSWAEWLYLNSLGEWQTGGNLNPKL